MLPAIQTKLVLVTGATGYVGGRLLAELVGAGYRVRCLARDPARLRGRAWSDQVEMAQGDMLQPNSLGLATRDVRVVYYLVHSLGGGGDFADRDLTAARTGTILPLRSSASMSLAGSGLQLQSALTGTSVTGLSAQGSFSGSRLRSNAACTFGDVSM